jgi:diguanylate cyclase (GGDEF)-like protein
MATYLVINRLLVFGVICLANAKLNLRVLIGTASEIGFEAGTLSLGGLTALALSVQPALAVLALLPTYALQRGALVRELEVAASQDPKTGLLNPVAWQTLAKRELSRAAREDHPATVLIIDLDHFKLVNDGWGHVVGDAVLRGVAQCLREELRDYDTIGRFGGEEFVAILPDVDELHGALIAERLRVRVGDLLIAACAESVNAPIVAALLEQRLSASIGVACFPEHGLELEHLLVGADAALYRAKDRGRNRVEFAGGPELGPRERIGD